MLVWGQTCFPASKLATQTPRDSSGAEGEVAKARRWEGLLYTFDEFAGWRRMFSGCEEHQGGRVRQSARGWFFEIGSGRPFLGTCGSNTVPVEAAPDCEAGCARCQEWGRRQSSKLVPGRRCGRHRASIVPALGRQCARKSWVHTVALQAVLALRQLDRFREANQNGRNR